MERAEGFTATLGLVKPGTVDRITQDFWRMTPADVNLTLYGTNWSLKMLHSGQFDAAAFDTQRDAILEAVRELLLYHDLDFIAVSGDLIQSAMGPVWDRALRESIREAAGVPATTAMTALTDALEHVGARRVAVGTPFREEQNDYVRHYLEQAGFSVTAVEGYPTRNSKEIRTLPANVRSGQPRQPWRHSSRSSAFRSLRCSTQSCGRGSQRLATPNQSTASAACLRRWGRICH
jgi:maleate cis-trans isomerase